REPIPGPAAKVGRVRVIQPGTVSREQEPAAWLEQAPALAQVPVQVPDVLEHLEGDDAVNAAVRQFERPARLDPHIDVAVEIAEDAVYLAPGQQRLVGTVPTPEIEDPLTGLLPRGAVEEVLDARAQMPHHVPVVIAPDARLQPAIAVSPRRLLGAR